MGNDFIKMVRGGWLFSCHPRYIYTRVDDDGLLWKCARASDFGERRGGNLVLYLVWSPADDYWYAIDEAADVAGGASAILESGHRIYRTNNNAVVGGWCYWEVNRSGSGLLEAWQGLGRFQTVVLA